MSLVGLMGVGRESVYDSASIANTENPIVTSVRYKYCKLSWESASKGNGYTYGMSFASLNNAVSSLSTSPPLCAWTCRYRRGRQTNQISSSVEESSYSQNLWNYEKIAANPSVAEAFRAFANRALCQESIWFLEEVSRWGPMKKLPQLISQATRRVRSILAGTRSHISISSRVSKFADITSRWIRTRGA